MCEQGCVSLASGRPAEGQHHCLSLWCLHCVDLVQVSIVALNPAFYVLNTQIARGHVFSGLAHLVSG